MGRKYTISFSKVSVSAAQDLFEYKAVAGKSFILHEAVCAQDSKYGDANAGGLAVTIKRATGAYSSGSGGSTPTPAPHSTSDTAAGGSAKANNTVRASGGTITTLRADAFNEQGGWQYLPTPETRFDFASGANPEGVIIGLETAPAAACSMSGSMVIEELG